MHKYQQTAQEIIKQKRTIVKRNNNNSRGSLKATLRNRERESNRDIRLVMRIEKSTQSYTRHIKNSII